jgi:DNA polymerase-3 subunit epsilon
MREIVLDTETTGLEPGDGHRIVEIGAVELVNHLPTGRTFHTYLNPERPMPKEAYDVHGLDDAFLRDKPRFRDVHGGLLAFLGTEAPLVIHNAAFDMRFLNAELARLGLDLLPEARAIDTAAMARRKFPGAPASLDALCRRYGIDTTARTKHGALLDSELLAEVYLELIGGRQPDLVLTEAVAPAAPGEDYQRPPASIRPRPSPLPARLTPEEAAAHDAIVAELGPDALWVRRA